jgi:hypothetical protein
MGSKAALHRDGGKGFDVMPTVNERVGSSMKGVKNEKREFYGQMKG